jgi:hypothetical protein
LAQAKKELIQMEEGAPTPESEDGMVGWVKVFKAPADIEHWQNFWTP